MSQIPAETREYRGWLTEQNSTPPPFSMRSLRVFTWCGWRHRTVPLPKTRQSRNYVIASRGRCVVRGRGFFREGLRGPKLRHYLPSQVPRKNSSSLAEGCHQCFEPYSRIMRWGYAVAVCQGREARNMWHDALNRLLYRQAMSECWLWHILSFPTF